MKILLQACCQHVNLNSTKATQKSWEMKWLEPALLSKPSCCSKVAYLIWSWKSDCYSLRLRDQWRKKSPFICDPSWLGSFGRECSDWMFIIFLKPEPRPTLFSWEKQYFCFIPCHLSPCKTLFGNSAAFESMDFPQKQLIFFLSFKWAHSHVDLNAYLKIQCPEIPTTAKKSGKHLQKEVLPGVSTNRRLKFLFSFSSYRPAG